jgi:hypothetical protein
VDLGLSIPQSKIWEKTMALGGAAAAASATINGGTNGDLVCTYRTMTFHILQTVYVHQHKSDQLELAKYLLKRKFFFKIALHYISFHLLKSLTANM